MKIIRNDKVLALIIGSCAFGGLVWWQLGQPVDSIDRPAGDQDAVDTSGAAPAEQLSSEQLSSVELLPEKLRVASVAFATASETLIGLQSKVPGRLQYDDRRHVEIRSATGGMITEIHVKPGDRVRAGDVVVELNSPEIGSARADVLLRKSELKIATQNRDWQTSTCTGLQKLAEAIRSRHSVDNIRMQFRDVVLGKSRDQLLSAYSDLLLAESLATTAEQNAASGIVPGRVVEQRINARDNMESTLLSALEELTFAAKQSCQQAESQLEDARNRHRISLQTVATLLGKSPADIADSISPEKIESDLGLLQSNALSLVQLRAPFAGTVERRIFSNTERVAAGDSLLTLADTSTLWVAADLREREWNALSLKSGDMIQVVTSIPGMSVYSAVVHFVGREVDPATNAVPLIATIDNSEGKLRPGMFVRVVVPISEARETLTIPESSVLEHDRQTFVFVPSGDSAFRRVDIKRGIQTAGMVEVLSGLNNGDQVVSAGGFFLKSELLLKGEAE
jgi:cobalt-zinc-cadmium efflux system membrane fusion protein